MSLASLLRLSLALLTSVAIVALAIDKSQDAEHKSILVELPKLFDFDKFQLMFDRHYDSSVEELARRAYFIPRAIMVYVSSLNYYHRNSDYHLTINSLSDLTPAESELMENHSIDDEEEEAEDHSFAIEDQPLNLSNQELRKQLDELLKDFPEDSAIKRLLEVTKSNVTLTRLRRSVGSDPAQQLEDLEPREFTIDELFSTGKTSVLPEAARRRLVSRVESNNENYQQIELPSRAVRDQLKDLTKYSIELPGEDVDEFVEEARKQMRKSIRRHIRQGLLQRHKKYKVADQDRMIIDHSQAGCMLLPRRQYSCGSCYAFAGIAMYEWLYCKATGKLVQFSEQYVMDCAQEYMDGNGCHGGPIDITGKFTENFGLELARNYPYIKEEGKCPIDNEDNLKTAGYIRMKSKNLLTIPQELWKEYLAYGPLLIRIQTRGTDFKHYGAGVHKLKGCKLKGGHGVVLVGYGVFNGLEYWKIRNSYGKSWGENGYYRVFADSGKCIRPWGTAFATKNGKKLSPKVRDNNNYIDRRNHDDDEDGSDDESDDDDDDDEENDINNS